MLPGLLVSAASLGFVLWFSKPRQLLQALKQADLALVLLGVGLAFSWIFLRALVWRAILKNRPGFSQAFFTVGEGYLLNALLPFRLGEIARSLLMAQKIGQPFFAVFSSVIIERLIDLAFAVTLVLVTLAYVTGASWAGGTALALGAVVLVGFALLFLAALKRATILAWTQKITRRWPAAQKSIGAQLTAFITGLEVLTNPLTFLQIIALSGLNWLGGMTLYFVIMRAFLPHATWLQSAFLLGIASLGIAAPSSPGGVGVFELASVAALTLLKVEPATALAIALSLHLLSFLVSGVTGSIGLAQDGETLTGLYAKARLATQTLKEGQPH